MLSSPSAIVQNTPMIGQTRRPLRNTALHAVCPFLHCKPLLPQCQHCCLQVSSGASRAEDLSAARHPGGLLEEAPAKRRRLTVGFLIFYLGACCTGVFPYTHLACIWRSAVVLEQQAWMFMKRAVTCAWHCPMLLNV